MSQIKYLTKSEKNLLSEFLDYYDPEAKGHHTIISTFENNRKQDEVRKEDGVIMYKSFSLEL